jgi:Zn-dependent protease with chaperone function
VQFTRSKDGLGGVLRKVLGQPGSSHSAPRPLHPSVQHMLLVGSALHSSWFDTPPPLDERIRRIYGRPMAALGSEELHALKPDAMF